MSATISKYCKDVKDGIRVVLVNIENGGLLPLEGVVAVDDVVYKVKVGHVCVPPCVVFLRLRLELGDFGRPAIKIAIESSWQLGELKAEDVAVDSNNLGLHPTLALLLHVSIGVDVNKVAHL